MMEHERLKRNLYMLSGENGALKAMSREWSPAQRC
jgi:hypothetical protein